jgi:hypothetical protein
MLAVLLVLVLVLILQVSRLHERGTGRKINTGTCIRSTVTWWLWPKKKQSRLVHEWDLILISDTFIIGSISECALHIYFPIDESSPVKP